MAAKKPETSPSNLPMLVAYGARPLWPLQNLPFIVGRMPR
jgi:hypothetical protein